MFGLKNKIREQADDAKEMMQKITMLKEEVETMLKEKTEISSELANKGQQALAEYEKVKNELLQIKNNSNLKPRDKISQIKNKKCSIDSIVLELEEVKLLLGVK